MGAVQVGGFGSGLSDCAFHPLNKRLALLHEQVMMGLSYASWSRFPSKVSYRGGRAPQELGTEAAERNGTGQGLMFGGIMILRIAY